MIRIIAGEARGRIVKTLPGKEVRPILARIRKSLFDILSRKVVNATFLDLFAGNGTVGLEALSRGAQKAVFVDNDPRCIKIIQQNLENFRYLDKAELWQVDVLRRLPDRYKFDLIFVGVPYKDINKVMLSLTEPTLQAIDRAGILEQSGWIIVQHHKTEKVPEQCGSFTQFRQKKYGDSCLSFYQVTQNTQKQVADYAE